MSEHKTTQLPNSSLSYIWLLFKTWWTLVPVGLLTAYGVVTSLVDKLGLPEQKAWWDGLLRSRFGWQSLFILALVSALIVVIEHSHQILHSLAEEISDLKSKLQNSGEWLKLFAIQKSLEQEIASLEMNIPAVQVTPAIKIGKDTLDFAEEEIERKKKYLKQITDRMEKVG